MDAEQTGHSRMAMMLGNLAASTTFHHAARKLLPVSLITCNSSYHPVNTNASTSLPINYNTDLNSNFLPEMFTVRNAVGCSAGSTKMYMSYENQIMYAHLLRMLIYM
jgi:hypothetical protein